MPGLAASKPSMMPRSEPAGNSGSHHWTNSIVVSATATVVHIAIAAAAVVNPVRDLIRLIFPPIGQVIIALLSKTAVEQLNLAALSPLKNHRQHQTSTSSCPRRCLRLLYEQSRKKPHCQGESRGIVCCFMRDCG